jgi:hypothetical protein
MKHGTSHRLFMIKMTEVIEVTETITVLIKNDLSHGINNDACPELNFTCLVPSSGCDDSSATPKVTEAAEVIKASHFL